MFRDFKQAFEKVTGLPLTMHLPNGEPECSSAGKPAGTTPFCARMAGAHHARTTYVEFQERLEEEAALQPKTLKCLAGMCETAVPVRVGEKLIAFLQTGGVLLATPNRRYFSGVAREFLRLGTPVELKRFEKNYYVARVLAPEQYDSMVRLVAIFAGHLAACGDQFASQRMAPETPTISRARQIIATDFREELSLGSVAEQVKVSPGYFSELFKIGTGLNFVEYVARLRVGEAHTLLRIPKSRVSDGHTLLLLDATESYHREIARKASDLPEEVRSLLPHLRDGTYTRVLIVTLPEATPVHEAALLQDELRRAHIEPFAWVINQSFAESGSNDPLLTARGRGEGRFIREVVETLSKRTVLVPWVTEEPVGPERLQQLFQIVTVT